MRSSASPFSFVKIQNPNPKPGFDLVQTRNPGLERDVRVWNPYRALLSADYGSSRHAAAKWRLLGLIHILITIDPLETVVHIRRINNWKMSLDKGSDSSYTELEDMCGRVDA